MKTQRNRHYFQRKESNYNDEHNVVPLNRMSSKKANIPFRGYRLNNNTIKTLEALKSVVAHKQNSTLEVFVKNHENQPLWKLKLSFNTQVHVDWSHKNNVKFIIPQAELDEVSKVAYCEVPYLDNYLATGQAIEYLRTVMGGDDIVNQELYKRDEIAFQTILLDNLLNHDYEYTVRKFNTPNAILFLENYRTKDSDYIHKEKLRLSTMLLKMNY